MKLKNLVEEDQGELMNAFDEMEDEYKKDNASLRSRSPERSYQ